MQKKFFRMVVLGSAIFAMSQSINIETAHAGSVVDISSFARQHAGKLDNLLEKYGNDSIREQLQGKSEDTDERRTSTGNSLSDDDKWNVNSLLSHPSLRRFK